MCTVDDRLFKFLRELSDPSRRLAATSRLAGHLGAEGLLLFVRDTALDVLVPAPGLPQTMPGGAGWRELLARCGAPGRTTGEVAFPDRTQVRPATVVTEDGDAVAIAIGERVDEALLLEIQRTLPIVTSMLRAEQRAEAAVGAAAVAREQARQAHALSLALDAARHDLEGALAEAARLNRELQHSDRAKDEFLATMAHELRNPLAALLSALYLIRARIAADHPASRSAGVAVRQADRLARLVDDLLDLSRITHGKIDLQIESLDVEELVARAAESVRPHVEARRHTLEVRLVDGAIWMSADRLRVEQILTNLLGNAVKYTHPGGRIELVARRQVSDTGSRVCFIVKDNGIGISAAAIPMVFDLFVQVDRSHDTSQGGLGIGLTLVRKLVEMQNGAISLASEGPDKGTEVTVCFPEISPPTRPASAEAELHVVRPRSRRILIVDDNQDAAEMTAEFVSLCGHEARVVADGTTALAESEIFRPDVVLLDIGLPDMSGYEVAARIKQRQSRHAPLLVALTGYGQPTDLQRSAEAGFDHHFTKPVDAEKLERLLADVDAFH